MVGKHISKPRKYLTQGQPQMCGFCQKVWNVALISSMGSLVWIPYCRILLWPLCILMMPLGQDLTELMWLCYQYDWLGENMQDRGHRAGLYIFLLLQCLHVLFIGPESDHWLCLSLTNWLTNSLTHCWLPFSKLDSYEWYQLLDDVATATVSCEKLS